MLLFTWMLGKSLIIQILNLVYGSRLGINGPKDLEIKLTQTTRYAHVDMASIYKKCFEFGVFATFLPWYSYLLIKTDNCPYLCVFGVNLDFFFLKCLTWFTSYLYFKISSSCTYLTYWSLHNASNTWDSRTYQRVTIVHAY